VEGAIKNILIQKEGNIAIIRLNRPEVLNAMNKAMAAEAYHLGLVNHILPPEQLEKIAKELAHKIASKFFPAVKAAKEAINQAEGKDTTTGRSIAIALRALCESRQE